MDTQVVEQDSNKQLKIDHELRDLIPPLTDKEYGDLEDNLVKTEGCLSPIIVWNGMIIDGHNRYEICNKLDLPFEIKPIEFTDIDHAKLWIIQHQLGRRNLTPQ